MKTPDYYFEQKKHLQTWDDYEFYGKQFVVMGHPTLKKILI